MATQSEPACAGCSSGGQESQELEFVNKLIAVHFGKPGALIPILQTAQQEFGYLSETMLRGISDGLGEPLSKVFGVVTFYSFFSRVPRGKFLIRVCMGTACYVSGAQDILNAFKEELKVEVGQTTPDKLFTLDVARCFGTCGLAPAIMINDTVHQRVKPTQIRHILNTYRKESTQPE